MKETFNSPTEYKYPFTQKKIESLVKGTLLFLSEISDQLKSILTEPQLKSILTEPQLK
jgi:hypothetical protein